ncbi:hypothetical protein E4N20_21855 [Salmonella enterica]|uniref:Uncharacterized protein n=1 Tax=Salmonella enterica subsp. houtenae serovar 44:z36[z38]:- TaxID=1967609 RepID=A0A736I056_SALHO|nr:hypothetical protein [Salmonella enterica]ECZ5471587.1 hypothetical protein [Salmonella enterica subsp. houtenae]HAE7581358.1 hypothetical protein [Salmonella enterica subsp. houtenae serovar 44:z36[z38]:-]
MAWKTEISNAKPVASYRTVIGKPNGPFCPKCYEGSPKKLSSVMAATGIHSHFGSKYCHACQSHY